jgi:hypothetical protein
MVVKMVLGWCWCWCCSGGDGVLLLLLFLGVLRSNSRRDAPPFELMMRRIGGSGQIGDAPGYRIGDAPKCHAGLLLPCE